MKATLIVALAGNPNAGKTTIFNQMTGARQHVGNYPGVTVECKEGYRRHGNSCHYPERKQFVEVAVAPGWRPYCDCLFNNRASLSNRPLPWNWPSIGEKMMDTILVILIVAIAVFFAGKTVYRTLTGKNDGCHCGGKCSHSIDCKDVSRRSKRDDG